ncbi:MAG: nucleotidyltransferase family protein [Armatimonadota bacterium]
MADLALVVLAAGVGSRYGGLKQIDPVGCSGEVIMDYSVYDAIKAGFTRVVFVVSRDLYHEFRGRFDVMAGDRIDVDYVIQDVSDLPEGIVAPPTRKKPWGTGHAVLCCKYVVRSPFAVINADDFYGRYAFQLLADYLRGVQCSNTNCVNEYCMVGYRLENTLSPVGPVARGICRVTSDGYLIDVREHTRIESRDGVIECEDKDGGRIRLAPDTVVSMNAWGFTPSIFAHLESRFRSFFQQYLECLESAEFFLPDVVGDLVSEGKARVRVLQTHERWFGMTYREDREVVRLAIAELVRAGVYPAKLWD